MYHDSAYGKDAFASRHLLRHKNETIPHIVDIQNRLLLIAQPYPTKKVLRKGPLSGKRDSNSRPQPWQGCALPTELFPQVATVCFPIASAKVVKKNEPPNFRAKNRSKSSAKAYLCGDEAHRYPLFRPRTAAERPRQRRPVARRDPQRLRRQCVVHARGDPPLGRGHHPAHVATGGSDRMARPLPRTRGVTASRTGDHGREHPAGRLLRSALRPRSRPSLPDQTRDEGPRAYRIYRRATPRARPFVPRRHVRRRRGRRGGHRHGQRQCRTSFPDPLCRDPRPAAGTPPVGRRALGQGDARTVGRLGRRHPCLRGYGVPQRIDDLAAARI